MKLPKTKITREDLMLPTTKKNKNTAKLYNKPHNYARATRAATASRSTIDPEHSTLDDMTGHLHHPPSHQRSRRCLRRLCRRCYLAHMERIQTTRGFGTHGRR